MKVVDTVLLEKWPSNMLVGNTYNEGPPMTVVLWNITEAIIYIVPDDHFMAMDQQLLDASIPSSFLNWSSVTIILSLFHRLSVWG